MKVFWSDAALEDLSSLYVYIARDNPDAARKIATRIAEAVEILLPDNPHIGRPGRVIGTRELVIADTFFIVPYRVADGLITVLRVYHSARRWPDQL